MTEFRIRWPIVAVESLVAPILGGLIAIALFRKSPEIVAAVSVVMIALGVIRVVRVRRRRLQVSDTGLRVQRDKYALDLRWNSAVGVTRRKGLLGLIQIDDLSFSESTLISIDSQGRPSAEPRKLDGHPARTRVQISFYDKGWQSGLIGDELRARGIAVQSDTSA